METALPQRNVSKAQLGRVFGARVTYLTGGSPLGLATGGMLLLDRNNVSRGIGFPSFLTSLIV